MPEAGPFSRQVAPGARRSQFHQPRSVTTRREKTRLPFTNLRVVTTRFADDALTGRACPCGPSVAVASQRAAAPVRG